MTIVTCIEWIFLTKQDVINTDKFKTVRKTCDLY